MTTRPLDRSAAFTALLEFCPWFGRLSMDESSETITRFLDEFRASGSTDMAAYAKRWGLSNGPYGTALASLRGQLDRLGSSLSRWQGRGTTTGTAAERQAASTAMGAIDSMLRELYRLRGQLLREISTADEQALAGKREGGAS